MSGGKSPPDDEGRARVIEQLLQSTDFSRALVAIIPQKLFVKDESSVYLVVNEAYANSLGCSPEQMVGKDDFAFFPTEVAEKYRAEDSEVMRSGQPRQSDETFVARGREHRIRTSRSPLKNAAGEVVAVLGIFDDVAERAQDAGAERERLVRAIEQAAEVVMITDARGDIVYTNPAFEAVTGYSRAEVLGRNPRLLQSGVQDAAFYSALWATISRGETWHGRLVNKRKDGTQYTEDATISPVLDATGTITSYVAVKRDITPVLALEAQFLQAQKMESIGRLAGGVAHDFNNLLTVVLNFTGFALEAMKEDDPLRDDLLEVKKAGELAASLTRQLLAFSRKQVLQPQWIDLNSILSNMERMLRRIIGADIDLVRIEAPDLGLVKADPSQIEQVVMNLVINAKDAMPQGGQLTIETANKELDDGYADAHVGVEHGSYVMLAVSDTGSGMDEQTRARVFEPFFTTKEQGKGTGLGLSTVYGIINQSGGRVWVYSELGRGTTFKIYLRRETPAATKRTSLRPTRPPLVSGTETILAVDDDEAVRKAVQRTLEAAGYTVLMASSGDEALLVSRQHAGEIQLLLTDVVMPGMSGTTLVEELAKSGRAPRVLFMSGYTDDTIVHHGVVDAGIHFLSKPFAANELARKVREVLESGA